MFADQRERPLLQPKSGAFFYYDVGPFRMAAICSEYRDIRIDAERIIPPMTSGDHPAVKIEDAGKLPAIKGGN